MVKSQCMVDPQANVRCSECGFPDEVFFHLAKRNYFLQRFRLLLVYFVEPILLRVLVIRMLWCALLLRVDSSGC